MKGHKILLLGGSGLLGQSLQSEFAANEFNHIYVCSRKDQGGANHIQGDLLDANLVNHLVSLQFDLIINLTGQVTRPINDCLALNSVGIENLIRIVQKTPRCKLIHMSTVGVYGSCDEADETAVLNPETPYSTAKATAEKLLISNLPPEDLVIFRLSNLYGQEQLKGVFAYLIRSAKSDCILDFNNNGSLVRYFLHTNDCASIIIQFISGHIQGTSGIFNIIGPDKYSLIQLISMVEELRNIKFDVRLEPIKPYDNTTTVLDHKIKELSLYSHTMDIQSYLSNF